MTVSTFPLRPGSRFQVGKILSRLGGCVLGAVMLWWVAAHVGPQRGRVVVHVTEPGVVVNVGGRTFHVGDDYYKPLACELPAGEHQLTMSRGTTVLYAETFVLNRGEGQVLTAWRPPPRRAEPDDAGASFAALTADHEPVPSE